MKQEIIVWQWHQLDHIHIICTSMQTDNHATTSLWPFYGIGQAGHYIFILWFLSLRSTYVIGQTIYIFMLWFVLLSFFPRLISAAADWMSAILPHMVWP